MYAFLKISIHTSQFRQVLIYVFITHEWQQDGVHSYAKGDFPLGESVVWEDGADPGETSDQPGRHEASADDGLRPEEIERSGGKADK